MPWMAPAAASHGWRAAAGGEAVRPKSGAERRLRPWMAAAGAQRSARHGWRKKLVSHGWRTPLSEHGLKCRNGYTAASRGEGPPMAARSFASTHQQILFGSMRFVVLAGMLPALAGRLGQSVVSLDVLGKRQFGCAAVVDGRTLAFTNTISGAFRVFHVLLGGCWRFVVESEVRTRSAAAFLPTCGRGVAAINRRCSGVVPRLVLARVSHLSTEQMYILAGFPLCSYPFKLIHFSLGACDLQTEA